MYKKHKRYEALAQDEGAYFARHYIFWLAAGGPVIAQVWPAAHVHARPPRTILPRDGAK